MSEHIEHLMSLVKGCFSFRSMWTELRTAEHSLQDFQFVTAFAGKVNLFEGPCKLGGDFTFVTAFDGKVNLFEGPCKLGGDFTEDEPVSSSLVTLIPQADNICSAKLGLLDLMHLAIILDFSVCNSCPNPTRGD